MCKPLLLILVVLAGCTAPNPPTAAEGAPPELHRLMKGLGTNLYDYLDAGAQVYVGRVVDYKMLRHQAPFLNTSFDSGTLVFRVDRTLRGAPRKELRLPFNLLEIKDALDEGSVRVSDYLFWPDFRRYPDPIIVVVLPGYYDFGLGPVAGLDGAVAELYETGYGDPSVVAAVELICRLQDMKDAQKQRESLASALTRGLVVPEGQSPGFCMDAQMLVREYATRAILRRYTPADPDWVCEILGKRAWAEHDAANSNMEWALNSLTALASDTDNLFPMDLVTGSGWRIDLLPTRRAAVHNLLPFLDAPGRAWSERSWDLIRSIDGVLASLPLDAAQVFDAEERRYLDKDLTGIDAVSKATDRGSYEPMVRRVQVWLNKPPIPATQPAATQRAGPGR